MGLLFVIIKYMDKNAPKKEGLPTSSPNECPEVKGNFSWDNFDLDKFFEDFDKVGKIIKIQKEEDERRFI